MDSRTSHKAATFIHVGEPVSARDAGTCMACPEPDIDRYGRIKGMVRVVRVGRASVVRLCASCSAGLKEAL